MKTRHHTIPCALLLAGLLMVFPSEQTKSAAHVSCERFFLKTLHTYRGSVGLPASLNKVEPLVSA